MSNSIKNKIFGVGMFVLGLLSVWACDNDVTFFIVMSIFSVVIIFSKEPLFGDDDF